MSIMWSHQRGFGKSIELKFKNQFIDMLYMQLLQYRAPSQEKLSAELVCENHYFNPTVPFHIMYQQGSRNVRKLEQA